MFNLSKIFRSETGKIIVSILLGLGLATMFRAACKGRNCVLYRAPKEITNQMVCKSNGKCYRVELEQTDCRGERVIDAE